MRVKVCPMRHQGRNLHHQEQMQLPPYVGELRVAPERDAELGRPVLRAHLRDASQGSKVDLLPELTDVNLLFAGDGLSHDVRE
ncbi:hypothetical protein [Hydrogenophaga taeniospiralis]|uniref:hypothetical protein n=1 Tax=Hydrogenophaga taeniospiralis TaxID=65656 RepID=UPI001CFBC6F3|nr:hypothetical protein [Hydrogenophaga taeniospiralis]UCU92135.1 hypothetical protein KI616_14765 [Hydrogenophaga taeniospiralis]